MNPIHPVALPSNYRALALAASTLLPLAAAQAQPAGAPPPLPAPSMQAPAKPGSGLLNDWLRRENPSLLAWDIGGQFRARFEHREYYATPGQAGAIDFRARGGNPDNTYLLLREKVHVGYTARWFNVFVEARDSSSHGDDRNPNPDADQFDLHQAYIGLGNAEEFPLTLKVGRQELAYGDERLVGSFDWNNIGRVFDAVKLRYETPDFWLDLFTSRVVLVDDHSFNMPNEYELFSGAYASTRTLIPRHESQIYFLARNTELASPTAHAGDTPQAGGVPARDIYTAGVRFKSMPGEFAGWDYSAELIGQLGRFRETLGPRAGQNLDHQAYAAILTGGYTWTQATAKPRLGLEYNFASGDNDPTDNEHGTFDNLYPTNHKFYGGMDFVSLQNIHNLRLASSLKPHPKLSLNLDYHLFWLADTSDNFYGVSGARRGGVIGTPGTGYGVNSGYGNFVGSELDLVATWTLRPYAIAQVGYSHFFVGDYVERSLSGPAHGSRDADFVYAQLTLNF